MYTRLTRFRMLVKLASPAYLRLRIIEITILQCINVWRASVYGWNSHPPPTCGQAFFEKLISHEYTSNGLPYARVTRIPRLLGVNDYLNNYLAMYRRLTRFRIRMELASPAYFGLIIIWIINFPCIHVWRASLCSWNSHPPPTWG